MLFPTVSRAWNGIYIEGERIGLQLQPYADGRIGVSVTGLPSITGFDRPCRLSGDDSVPYFAPAEIAVHDTRLECFAADQYAPVLRAGFTLELEPGMAQLLRAWMGKLTAVASASKALADTFSAQLPPPVHHMLESVTAVVARIVLAGWNVDHSVAYEREHGTWGGEHGFMAQFDEEGVRQALRALARADDPGHTTGSIPA
jgi:hypothetical protein